MMEVPPSPPAGPGWVQILLSVLGALGGVAGVGTIATVLVQRRKLRADTADVLTDTALALVEPLRERIGELETEVRGTNRRARGLSDELDRMREAARDLTTLMRRWRSEILAPDASLEHLREMVQTAPGPPINGRQL